MVARDVFSNRWIAVISRNANIMNLLLATRREVKNAKLIGITMSS